MSEEKKNEPGSVKAIIVVEAGGRERTYAADMWEPCEDHALHVHQSSRETDPIVARYAPGSWLSVREDGAAVDSAVVSLSAGSLDRQAGTEQDLLACRRRRPRAVRPRRDRHHRRRRARGDLRGDRAVTAQTPERDTRAETLGRIFHAAYTAVMPRSHTYYAWEGASGQLKSAIEAGAAAVAAHVANPAAADYDSAADLGAAYADLESEIRVAVSLHCTGPGIPCDLCLRETGRAMKAIDDYARDVAQHERTRERPAPELAAAMAETRELRELLEEILRTYGDSSGDGWRSRVGQVKYRQWRLRAGLPR